MLSTEKSTAAEVKNGSASKRHNRPLVDENERKANLRKRVNQLKRTLPKKLFTASMYYWYYWFLKRKLLKQPHVLFGSLR